MRLKIKVQRHLVVAHEASESGEWIFTLCRAGLSRWLGRRLVPGEELEIEVSGEVIEHERKQSNA